MTGSGRARLGLLALLISAGLGASCAAEPGRDVAGVAAVTPPARTPPVELEASADLPLVRFDAGSRLGSVALLGVEAESVVQDPLAAVTLRITLRNTAATASTGSLLVALPSSTILAQTEDGAALRPSLEPADHGDLLFSTEPLRVEPNAEKTVVVRFAAALTGPARSVVLRLSTLGALPKGALADLTLRSDAPEPAEGLTLKEQTLVRQAPATTQPRPIRSAILLLDSSARRTRDLPAQWRLAHELSQRLAPTTPLIVAAFDDAPTELYRGPAGELPSSVGATLGARGALGRANVDRALDWALAQGAEATDRVLIVTDAMQLARSSNVTAWVAPWKLSATRNDARVDVIVPSGARSQEGLAALVSTSRRGGRIAGLYDDGALEALLAAGDSPAGEPSPAHALSSASWPLPSFAAVSEVVTARSAAASGAAAAVVLPAWAVPSRPQPTPDRTLGSAREIALGARPFRKPDGSPDDRRTSPTAQAPVNPHSRDPLSAELDESAYGRRIQPDVLMSKPEPPTTTPASASETPKAPDVTQPRGTLPPDAIKGIVRRNFGRFRACYQEVLRKIPSSAGRVVVEFTIHPTGIVSLARSISSDITDSRFVSCVVTAFESLSFPPSDRDAITVKYPLTLAKADGEAREVPATTAAPWQPISKGAPPLEPPKEPWQGTIKIVYEAIARGDAAVAVAAAERLVKQEPGDRLGYVALSDALAAAGDEDRAARAISSIVELAPAQVPSALLAAGRLRVRGTKQAWADAQSVLEAALGPNDPPAPLLQALAAGYAQSGEYRTSLALLDVGLGSTRVSGSVALRDALRADLAVYGAAAVQADPSLRWSYGLWLADIGVVLADPGAFRVSATWTGEGSDLDLLVQDVGLSRTTRLTPALPTGGRHLGDIAHGPAVESFLYDRTLNGRAYPYALIAKLRASSERFEAGVIEVADLGNETLTFSARPFVIQTAGAEVEVSRMEGPPR